ncbi:MAG: class I SAM-dependent rRNA methyltransferase [Isosphaeraceae bacterium]
MADRLPRVTIKPRRARPFFARHPWVFVTSIERVEDDPEPGGEVEVVSHEGRVIGCGLFNPSSAIRVRLYRWDEGPLDDNFWLEKLRRAVAMRTDILGLGAPRAGYRLVYSEGDGLSGLVVDRYDRWVVAQYTSLALFNRRHRIAEILRELTQAEGVLTRTERSTAEQEGLPFPSEDLLGTLPIEPIEIVENGITYWVDLRAGQKTGFFLDQRENRSAVAAYCRGRRVLDLYSYTGGFALNASRAGAASVLGVDSSGVAVEVARHHATINGIEGVEFVQGDCLVQLDELRSAGRRFDVVICDPPKFARSPRNVEDALKAYLKLNRAALDVLEPGGILVTCSCSGLVDRGLFADVLGQVAELSTRPVQILEQRGQAPDHPVSASCLETEYLKCFICRVG